MSGNTRSKVLVTEAMPLFEEERRVLENYAEVLLARNPAEDSLVNEAADADVIMVVYAKITSRIMNSARNLKGIVRYGIGVDNIDIGAATNRGVYVANVPDYCIGTVADHAFALLLALDRRILIADRMMRTGEYRESWTSPSARVRGFDLEGKSLGVISLGRIGRALAKRAKGFGMVVIAYDPYVDREVAEELGVRLTDLDTVLKESDFVSIHSPLLPETYSMIGQRELRLMKETAFLINVARGPIVDEKALIQALEKGWIAGAGIDVYKEEPPDFGNPLFGFENVVLTPHIAWYTDDALHRLEMSAVQETIRILQGESPRNLVNRELLSI